MFNHIKALDRATVYLTLLSSFAFFLVLPACETEAPVYDVEGTEVHAIRVDNTNAT
ncbi:MAG: hypothetical protein GY822_20710 [Deltaproteobacteria bacterium]|nr:hypothetical protein [Deltaproteobacteria bacterium]